MTLLKPNLNPEAKDLRLFGLLSAAAMAASSWWWVQTFRLQTIGFVVAAVVAAVALLFPQRLRLIYLATAYLLMPVGRVVGEVILVFIYFGVITPIGVIRRTLRRQRRDKSLTEPASFWVSAPQQPDAESYLRQY